jgi:hypothetical protein
MKIEIISQKSNAIFNPLRVLKKINKNRNAGENISRAILGTIDAVVETPLAILENFYRIPAGCVNKKHLEKDMELGTIDIPNRFETENLFNKVERLALKAEETSILRQNFIDQYSNEYDLHRLDFNFTPLLNKDHRGYRIMDMDINFKFETTSPAKATDVFIKATDVFPQTKWEKEGITVGDHVYLNAKGTYSGGAQLKSSISNYLPMASFEMNPATTAVDVVKGRDYFYSIQYETEIPTVEGKALSDGFGWRLRGTFKQYIASGTIQLTAILLVSKEINKATISGNIECGITKRDRRDSTDYPTPGSLKYGSSRIPPISLYFGGKKENL